MIYLNSKNIGRGHPQKADALRVMRDSDWQLILDAVEASAPMNPKWQRDWAIVFLGMALGQRRGEVALLNRDHFRDLQEFHVIHAPTLKQAERITYTCPNPECVTLKGKRTTMRVSSKAAGQPYECSKCWSVGTVSKPKSVLLSGVVERDIDVVEPKTVDFIFDYLDSYMRPDQKWLFEGRPGYHMSAGHVNCIFNTYLVSAGLNPKISFHSLRHGRGMNIYSLFRDMKAVQSGLRHKDVKSAMWYAEHDEETKQQMREALNAKAFDPLKRLKKGAHARSQ